MLTPAALLLCLVTLPDAPESVPIRQQHPLAAWVAPQLTFHSIGGHRADIAGSDVSMLPLGVQAGLQLGAHAFVSLSYGRLPIQYAGRTQFTVGGRWYLANGRLAPYLAAEAGSMREELDDTGGLTASHTFAIAGIGAELVLGYFSITSDLQLGPEHRSDFSESTWHFSGWYRLGVGFRL